MPDTHLGRVDNASRYQVSVGAGLCVKAIIGVSRLEQLANNDGSLSARIVGDCLAGDCERSLHDLDACVDKQEAWMDGMAVEGEVKGVGGGSQRRTVLLIEVGGRNFVKGLR